ncbi:MAG: hypothetical protein VX335_00920 [Pseudomonadota bacterium]|nr:hypothetical protein [Pseudomonadota bacterium]
MTKDMKIENKQTQIFLASIHPKLVAPIVISILTYSFTIITPEKVNLMFFIGISTFSYFNLLYNGGKYSKLAPLFYDMLKISMHSLEQSEFKALITKISGTDLAQYKTLANFTIFAISFCSALIHRRLVIFSKENKVIILVSLGVHFTHQLLFQLVDNGLDFSSYTKVFKSIKNQIHEQSNHYMANSLSLKLIMTGIPASEVFGLSNYRLDNKYQELATSSDSVKASTLGNVTPT